MRLAAALVILTGLLGAPGQDPAITVSAAISLSDALEEIARSYQSGGGTPVRFNFAGSNVLARQIINGAPVDVFVSADATQMRAVEAAGAVVMGSAVAVASNQLAVVSLPERVGAIRSAFPRGAAVIRRLALGDPAAVPAGVYARGYLERAGLWQAYEPRIVPTGNVRAALAAVESGSVDAAIVYATDVRQASRARVAILVPVADAPRILYPAAVIARSRRPEAARRFVAFLRSAAAKEVLARHGFLPVDGQ